MVILRFKIRHDLELKTLNLGDANDLYELTGANLQRLKVWLPWADEGLSLSSTQNFILGGLEQAAQNQGFQAGIWFQERLAGVIGYHRIDWVNRSVALGYWIGAQYEGKGLVTEASRILVDYAFRELGLNRVEIRCATDNHRSRAIPERLGFRREGILRQVQHVSGRCLDHAVYGLLAREWAGNLAPRMPSYSVSEVMASSTQGRGAGRSGGRPE